MRTPQSVGAKWPKMLSCCLHYILALPNKCHSGNRDSSDYTVFFPPSLQSLYCPIMVLFCKLYPQFPVFTDMSGTQGHCGPSASTLFSISLTVLCILWKQRVADVTFFMPSFIFLTQTTMDTFLNHLSSFGSLVLTSACRLYLVYMAKWIASLFYDCLRYLLRPALGTVAGEYMCHLPANTVSL